jgi:hypothetical protein
MTWTRIVLMARVTALKRLSGDKAQTFFVGCSLQRTITLLPSVTLHQHSRICLRR